MDKFITSATLLKKKKKAKIPEFDSFRVFLWDAEKLTFLITLTANCLEDLNLFKWNIYISKERNLPLISK